jgi:F-type H+-transporting ATPase subunit epsilon
MATIRIEIVTAERRVLEDEVDMVIAPGIEGQLGILPRHAPLLTALQPGEIRLKKGGGETAISVTGGFLEVLPDRVTVLADAAEREDEIDLARAEEAMRRAQERVRNRGTDMDLARATVAMRRASSRLKVARRRSGRGGVPGAPQSS